MCIIVIKKDEEHIKREIKENEQINAVLSSIRHNVAQNNLSKATRFEELLDGKISKVPVYANPTRVWYEFKSKDKESIKIYLEESEYGETNLEGKLNDLIERNIKLKRATNIKRFVAGVAIAGSLIGLAYGLVKTIEYEDKMFSEKNHAYATQYNNYSQLDNEEIEFRSSHKK